ncbi:uroporphyrinogen-III synthase [Carboxylicivirga sediminis]|uniref:Uroporphyrinogen-III synthase n=1 Tax=Carboxylicivirga sediminis TaxID=2006564 RepID=A0A941F895_9BACT|nr:uroporphyrinogen-III synthase [Carboxylicivirga sediminis]MBR8538172.1 uroporphyrinogen-III synthase [Carboxylicivirga sediminis]
MEPYSQPKAVVLTHPMGNDDLLYNGLVSEGIEVVCDPMIDTELVKLEDDCRHEVYTSRRIIFTSKRGVEYFFQQMKPADVLDKSFICIGKKTAQVLESYGVKPWWVSGGRTASDLVKELQQAHIRPGEKWLGMLGELAENTLEDGLKGVCHYRRYNVYRTIIADKQNEQTLVLLKAQEPLLIVCTSPSCFTGFMNLYGSHMHDQVGFASIGPATTKVMKKQNVTPVVTARMSTYEGLWQEMKLQLKPEYR